LKVSMNSKGIIDMTWQNRWQKVEPVDPDSFDPSTEYNNRELEAYADAILRADSKQFVKYSKEQGILFPEHIYIRQRREIGNSSGIADPTLTASLQDKQKPGRHSGDGQTMYNRRHPRGRKVNSEQQRKDHGASYYRS
jgi:hypothetical protein